VGALWSLAMVAVESAAGAGGCCVGVGVGSADSSAPVIDWKPVSLGEVMVMVLGQIAAALVACWVQCAAKVLCCAVLCCLAAVNDAWIALRPGSQTRLDGDTAHSRWTGPQQRAFAVNAGRRAVACGRCVHWQRVCGGMRDGE
jgi:hypothetical protein